MSFFEIKDFIANENSEQLKKHFESHCNWCWGYGYNNCEACKKAFNKAYMSIRKKELQIRNGIIKNDN